MNIKRKTELGQELQKRAERCRELALNSTSEITQARLSGKAEAYEHAAEMADSQIS